MSFFSQKKNKKLTRLFFATDIHGSERNYRKFINAGKFYDVNVVVMGGEGILRGCLVTFADGKVEGFQMTSG